MTTWGQLEGRRISDCWTLVSGLGIDKTVPISNGLGVKGEGKVPVQH